MQGILHVSEASNLAVHALAYLAGQAPGTAAAATLIASRLGVSESHLGKVLQRLVKLGFLTSVRGARGGFSLARDPATVSLLEVLEAVDGPLLEGGCLLGTPVCPAGRCRLRGLLDRVTRTAREELGALRLRDFASEVQATALSPGRRPGAGAAG